LEIVKSAAMSGFDAVKNAFAGFFDWLKGKVNWLLGIVGMHPISGNAGDIAGFNQSYGGGGSGAGGGSSSGTSPGGGHYGASPHAIHRAYRAAMGGGVSLGEGSGVPTGNTAVWNGLPAEARGLLDAISGPESGPAITCCSGVVTSAATAHILGLAEMHLADIRMPGDINL
jgi:hypothetical protein